MTDSLTIVMPWNYPGGEREDIYMWNISRLSSIFPDATMLIGEDYSEPFNRSAARNNGARRVRTEFMAFVDADTVFNPMVIHNGVEAIKNGAPWCIPFDRYLRSDSFSANQILNSRPGIKLNYKDYNYEHVFTHPPTKYESPESGCIVFRSSDVAKFGGYNEDFVGWGFEDRAVVYAADCVLGKHERITGTVLHIWHPEAPSDPAKNAQFYGKNERLAAQMKAITDPSEMMALNGPL